MMLTIHKENCTKTVRNTHYQILFCTAQNSENMYRTGHHVLQADITRTITAYTCTEAYTQKTKKCQMCLKKQDAATSANQ